MSINLDYAAKMMYCMEPLKKLAGKAIITSSTVTNGTWGLDVDCGIDL